MSSLSGFTRITGLKFEYMNKAGFLKTDPPPTWFTTLSKKEEEQQKERKKGGLRERGESSHADAYLLSDRGDTCSTSAS